MEKYGFGDDIHKDVAARIADEGLGPVLDVGCGTGNLIRPLRELNVPVVGFDTSPTMLQTAPDPRVRGDARSLPFTDGSFGAVTALYMLCHFEDPNEVIAECRRVLRSDGLFAASAPSRHDDPELAPYVPASPPLTFDAERGTALIGEAFQDIDLDSWDLPYYRLPDREALELYLYSHLYPIEVSEKVDLPLTLTKRGAIIYGYKRI